MMGEIPWESPTKFAESAALDSTVTVVSIRERDQRTPMLDQYTYIACMDRINVASLSSSPDSLRNIARGGSMYLIQVAPVH